MTFADLDLPPAGSTGRSEAGAVLAALRRATAAAHERLERRFDAACRLSSAAGRAETIPRYYRMHAGAEAAWEPWLPPIARLRMPERRRTPLLRAALSGLGLPIPPLPVPPMLTSQAEALGLLYVMEGSSLGGRTILRRLPPAAASSLGFLDPYGRSSGEWWRELLAVLDQRLGGSPADIAAACTGAEAGFAFAETCLCGDHA